MLCNIIFKYEVCPIGITFKKGLFFRVVLFNFYLFIKKAY